jgi:cytoskeletal protein RodZ
LISSSPSSSSSSSTTLIIIISVVVAFVILVIVGIIVGVACGSFVTRKDKKSIDTKKTESKTTPTPTPKHNNDKNNQSSATTASIDTSYDSPQTINHYEELTLYDTGSDLQDHPTGPIRRGGDGSLLLYFCSCSFEIYSPVVVI